MTTMTNILLYLPVESTSVAVSSQVTSFLTENKKNE